jgi:hypothetical protein
MQGVGAYVDELEARWAQRAERASSATTDVVVAGWHVRIAGTPPPIANAVAGSFDRLLGDRAMLPDLQINVAAGAPPQPPRGKGWGELDRLHFHDGRIEIHAAPNAPLSVLDHERSRATCWFPEPDLPYWELGAPFRSVLAWYALRRSAFLAHGAAVAEGGRAVLLLGPGGAGKSTTTLAAWVAGMDYLGDDYVLVRVGPSVTVARTFATAKVDDGTVALVPAIADFATCTPAATGTPSDKTVLRLVGARGLDVVEAEVAAVVVPRVAPRASLSSIGPGEALRAAAPSTLFQLAAARDVTFPMLAEVVRRTPCFALETGPDPHAAAALLRELVWTDCRSMS